MQKTDPFVHLHVHTDASVLDGFGTASETVKAAAQLGQPAIAFTDHGSTTGIYRGYQAAKTEGIKFIAGIEAYFAPSNITHTDKTPVFFGEGGRDDVAGRGAYTHLTLLAYNNTGLSNLFRLNLRASTEGFFRKPRMSLEMLQEHHEGLIVTTGCPSGEVQTRLRLGQFDQALGFAAKLVDMLGKENVYVELMDHGMKSDLERGVRTGLMEIAKILDLKLVSSNDSHYAHKEDSKSHEELLAIQTGAYMSEPPDHAGGKRFAFEGHEYYIKSAAQMLDLFPERDFPGAVSNTLEVAERVNILVEPRNDLRPHFPLPDGYTSDNQYLTDLAYAGLKERLPGKADDPVYKERLETELSVIIPKDYANYFLVVADFIKWAKDEGIPVGPARGSAGGSLLAFCLHITDVEPVKHDLLFERFLNPERDSPPDIDVDFDDRFRERVYEYTVRKYGYEHVSQVITFGGMKGKNSLKDEARIYEFSYDLSNALTKAYPPDVFGKSMPLNDIYNPDAKRYDEADSFRSTVKELGAERIVESALKLEGRMRSTGVHACAVLISGKPLTTAVPLEMRQNDGIMVAQWEYPSCEALGLLKMDFLGLRNLGIVADTVKLVEKHRGVKIDLDELKQGDMDDPATFKLLADGNTLGVFQLDGGPMRDLLKMMKPSHFDDISAVLALYRPGPMGVNAHTDYALRKNGLQEIDWIHPEFEKPLRDILAPTFGLCVTGDTLIWDAAKNVQVRVDEVQEQVKGDEFFTYSLNESTGLVEKKRVSHWFETGVKPVIELVLNDGRVLRVSGDHPIRTVDGYVKASELVAGSHVASPGRSFGEVTNQVSVDGSIVQSKFSDPYLEHHATVSNKVNSMLSWAKVKEIRNVDPEMMYDITVEDNHNFLANNVVVHNCVYQEQVMQIAQKVSSYSLAQADNLRRAMGKKKREVLDAEYVPFRDGAKANGYSDEAIQALWDVLVPFADYSFNKCFSDRTLIRMGDGSVVSGRELLTRFRTGEELWVQSMWSDGEVRPHKVKQVVATGVKPAFRVKTADGRTIITSEDHRLMTTRGYVQVKDMVPGVDELIVTDKLPVTARQQESAVKSIRKAHGLPLTDAQVERVRYVSEGQGYGRKSFASNGMWCESQNERVMAEWLIELGVDFEMHKPVGGGQCDFYFEGLYWEMDGMDRHVSYFERKYGDLPFVVVTPEDFRERVSETLGLEHVRNGDLIMSIEPVSRQTSMIDIEMEADGPKNFVTSKGVVSHNSHTVGYGYMSYLTAYLKANYPAEFFAALLSSVADSTEKTALYLDDARRNGVKVSAPDVNHSGRDYAPLGTDGVLFGLKAVKGVSDAVSDLVVEERERGGSFKDFSDLMNRLPRTIVNKRVFEALAYGGAFDGLGVSRQAVVTALPGLLDSFQKAGRVAKKQEAMGGVSLFDGFDFEEELKPSYEVPVVEEFPNMVKLKHERDYLGLYVSGHPLDGLNLDAVGSGTVRVGEVLSENVVVVPDGQYPQRGKEPIITLAGLVSSWGVRLTKKGKQFGSGVLEDRSGSIEFVLFSDAFKDYGSELKMDGLFALTGYPQHRGGGFSFVVSSLRPLEFTAAGNLPVRVRVTEDQWETGYHDFMLVLQNYAAPAGAKNGTELIVSVRRFDGSVYEETIPFLVLGSPALSQACRGVFGMKCIGRWRDNTL